MSLALLALAVSLSAAAAPGQRHPQPRVIVDVERVDGPHQRDDVQRQARSHLWHEVIRCYRAGAANKPKLEGDATFTLRIGADGDVSEVRSTGGTLRDEGVVACVARRIEEVPMPKASGSSQVAMQVHVAPGDPPRR